jgi:hypothetical protein
MRTTLIELEGCGRIGEWLDEYDGTDSLATLFCAAPDMQKALEGLFEHCAMVHRFWGDNSNNREADAAIKAAQVALDKSKESAGVP